MFIAHEYDGNVYVVKVETLEGTWPGAGCKVFDTIEQVQAEWPGLPVMGASDDSPLIE